jgi:hypothetical protein
MLLTSQVVLYLDLWYMVNGNALSVANKTIYDNILSVQIHHLTLHLSLSDYLKLAKMR